MPRVEVPITILNSTGGPVNGAAVAISHRSSGAPATWYTSEAGGAASTAAIISDANGRIAAWVDRGAYNLAVSGTGLTSYTEAWDATPGYDGSIDTLWLPDGGVTNVKLASGIDGGKITTGTIPAGRLAANSVGTSQIVDAAVTAAKLGSGAVGLGAMASGVGTRFLGGFELNKFAIGNNSDTQIGSGNITHNGKGGFAVLLEHAHHNDGSWSGYPDNSYSMWFRIKRAGSTVHQVDLDPQGGGFHASGFGLHTFGALSGTINWSVTVGIGNIPVTLQNWGRGALLVFEQY